jgi:hypothetical protein
MRTARYLFLIAGLFLVGIVFNSTSPENLIFPAEVSPEAPLSARTNWHPMVHHSHNSFHNWRLDHIVTGILVMIPQFKEQSLFCYHMLCLVIFLLGTTVLLHCLNPVRHIVAPFLSSLLLVSIIIYLWGGDTVVISSLTWLPFLTIALLYAASYRGVGLIFSILSLLLTFQLCRSANQLAPLVLLTALIISLTVRNSQPDQQINGRAFSFVLSVILFIPALVVLFQVPSLAFPDYPEMAHVVTHDGLPGMIRPLVGPITPVPVIDRAFIHAVYSSLSIILVISALLACWGEKKPRKGSLAWPALLFAVLVLLDTAPPELFSHILPLSTLSRLVPGFFYFPLASLLSALTLFLLFAAAERSERATHILCVLALIGYCTFGPLIHAQKVGKKTCILQDPNGQRTYLRYKDKLFETKNDPNRRRFLERIFISPSFNVLKHEGFWFLEKIRVVRKSKFVNPARHSYNLTLNITASHNNSPEQIRNSTDYRQATRWTSGGGRQRGTEWFHVHLNQPVTLHGLAPQPGAFIADFPRGVKISYKESCNPPHEQKIDDDQYSEAVNIPAWEGPVRITKNGFPYFGGQSEVKIVFPKPVTGQCFLIQQTGRSTRSDWSISKIGFFFYSGRQPPKS